MQETLVSLEGRVEDLRSDVALLKKEKKSPPPGTDMEALDKKIGAKRTEIAECLLFIRRHNHRKKMDESRSEGPGSPSMDSDWGVGKKHSRFGNFNIDTTAA